MISLLFEVVCFGSQPGGDDKWEGPEVADYEPSQHSWELVQHRLHQSLLWKSPVPSPILLKSVFRLAYYATMSKLKGLSRVATGAAPAAPFGDSFMAKLLLACSPFEFDLGTIQKIMVVQISQFQDIVESALGHFCLPYGHHSHIVSFSTRSRPFECLMVLSRSSSQFKAATQQSLDDLVTGE